MNCMCELGRKWVAMSGQKGKNHDEDLA
jgi:hypothetical protein